LETVRKQKSVIYKRVEFSPTSKVLETLLKDALENLDRPSKRRQVDSDTTYVIGTVKNVSNMLCGSLLSYEPGSDIAFVIEDDYANEYPIEQLSPGSVVTDGGEEKRREVLQSALYFGVWGNHMVIIQSQALKSRQLENHLTWLLSQEELLEDNEILSLSDEPTPSAREQIENLQPKTVEVGTPFRTKSGTEKGPDGEDVATFNLSEQIQSLLSAFLSDDVISSLKLKDSLEDSNLEATLRLRYKRKTTKSGHAALDDITRAIRHAEPEDTRIITSTGTIISGNNLKLTGKVSVDTVNGIVDAPDAFKQLHDWLASKIEEGSVT